MKSQHISIEDFNKDNWHLFVDKPDPDFSPEHNRAVIQQTIDEYEKLRYGVADKTKRDSQDRADILASFAKYKLDLGGEKKIEGYLGKARMRELYGEKLFQKVKMLESVKRLSKVKGE